MNELLDRGRLGRAVIVSARRARAPTTQGADPAQVCIFTVEVALGDLPRYTARCRQAVRVTYLPQLLMPGASVAVRVDAEDRSRIALSLGEEPPLL